MTLPHPEFEAAQPHLLIDGKLVCRRVIPWLRHVAAAPDYWKYMKKCYGWTQVDLNGVHWEVVDPALNLFQLNDQRRL